jgi:hypothetical protein
MDRQTRHRLRRLARERATLICEWEAVGVLPAKLEKGRHDAYRIPAEVTCQSFQRRCYKDGWIDPNFDWMAWIQSAEYAALTSGEGALEAALPEQLTRLLTATVRREKFTYGSLEAALRSGLLQRVTERAAALACPTLGDRRID